MPEPFLVHQGVRQLAETGDVRRFLHPDYFRSRRISGGGPNQADIGNWVRSDRDELLELLTDTEKDTAKNAARIVLTTDAGVGKSENLHWLGKELFQRFRGCVSILIKLGELSQQLGGRDLDPHHFIGSILAPILLRNYKTTLHGDASDAEVARIAKYLERLAASGRLVLLFDELDQVSASSASVRTLEKLLADKAFARTPIVVSGRPYALQDCWNKLFNGRPWQFFQFEVFTQGQQRTYLRDEQGYDRYEDLPEETKSELQDILSIPRVLSYLRKLTKDEFGTIRTPSDIYTKAIYHLVEYGLKKAGARDLGRPADSPQESSQDAIVIDDFQIRLSIHILAALAWEMLWLPPPGADDGIATPNFNRVQGGDSLDKLYRAAYERVKDPYYVDSGGYLAFGREVGRLKKMNEAIEQGFVDSKDMAQILWRNRSLQEFFAAFAICRLCTEGQDVERLWQWVHLHHDSRTEAFYWIWRFAAEMSDQEIDQPSWARAMSPLYRRGDRQPENTKRSTEMLYRTWNRMSRIGKPFVNEFLSEFQAILDKEQGSDRQKTARHFQSLFITVPAEPRLHMGTPRAKQGIPPEDREGIARELTRLARNAEQEANQIANDANYPPGPRGDSGRQWFRSKWLSILRGGGIEEYERWQYAIDETPDKSWRDNLSDFQMNRYPTLRAWYELFDPGHGLTSRWFHDDLAKRAPSTEHPALYLTWYDAWAFCQWAHWDGRSCRLPHEDEWEKGAKGGTPWDWRYWWGDKDLLEKRTANLPLATGQTTKPWDFDQKNPKREGDHTNPLGFVDILGNQWEWTADGYVREYRRQQQLSAPSRVCRGGGWSVTPRYVRSSVRLSGRPSLLLNNVGFRVARAS